MIQTGIFTGYFPYSLEETAQRIRTLGFNTVQLDVEFKGMDLKTLNDSKCKTIRDTFRAHNLPISCISAYTNLVHPELQERDRRLDRLKDIIRNARQLGSPYVVTETGTFNPDSDWVHHPKNKTDAGYNECRDVIGELVEFAAEHDVKFLVETYVNNVIGSVDETLRLFKDINSPNLKLLMDPTNYFEEHNIGNMDQELTRIFDELEDEILIAHAKDVKLIESDLGVQMADIDADESHSLRGVGKIELPACGLGELNYDLYLKRLAVKHPNIPIIIEHLTENDVPRAKKFLEQTLINQGV
jgi:sugar phosphate isomerase/epimerase